MARTRQADGQGGFSLIELMVAMVATMIVAGAIFGLLTAGNTAFRREPELAERQQNIRIAMSVIAEDILRAGTSLPDFQQVFSQGLNGSGPTGPHNVATDQLEMISTGDCPVLTVCGSPGVNVFTREETSACYAWPTPVLLVSLDCPDGSGVSKSKIQWAEEPGEANAPCGAGHINFPPGQNVILNPPGGWNCDPDYVLVGFLARYRIHADAEGTPNLERSAVGGQLDFDGNDSWEVIARGIEDLQVEYLDGSGVWSDEPGLVSCGSNCENPTPAEYDTLVQRVRVRLSARAMAANLQGQTRTEDGTDAVRGELVSEFAPKQATIAVAHARKEL